MLKQGRILPGIDMKIVDGDGNELPWDGVAFGDLMVKGPWIASAYYGDAPDSALDKDGWFATGDVATIDPDGFMEITDRSKDVIKSGGEWISSITLENIAVSHPDVAEAAVIAATHPKWDERPLLLVVPAPGKTVDPASVLALYEGKVAKWWLPDEVVVVPELPHTATGKLLKTSLRTRFKDHYLKASGIDTVQHRSMFPRKPVDCIQLTDIKHRGCRSTARADGSDSDGPETSGLGAARNVNRYRAFGCSPMSSGLPDPRASVARLPRGRAGVILRHDDDPTAERSAGIWPASAEHAGCFWSWRRLRLAALLGAGVHLRGGRWPRPASPPRRW